MASCIDAEEIFEQILSADVYSRKFNQMALDGSTSITINYDDIFEKSQILGQELIKRPDEILRILYAAARTRLRIEDPEYSAKVEKVKVRISDLYQSTMMRDVGSDHIGTLIQVHGIVMRAAGKKARMKTAGFTCRQCGTTFLVEQPEYSTNFLKKPFRCEDVDCQSRGPFEWVEEETVYTDEQEIWLQEPGEDMPPGEMPVAMHLKLDEDLVNLARPGDLISVVGIARSMPRKVKGGVLNTVDIYLQTQSIRVMGKETELLDTTANEREEIFALANDPDIHNKIIDSIAPAIYGYRAVKEAIMYQLFGGVSQVTDGVVTRGEINQLLIGDPGVAKSQLLKYTSKLGFRGVYTNGKGTSGVGLTATVTRDPDTNQFTLQAGAFVLADRGMVCVDEIDKMNKEDRVNIHEALEQQTISVAKGGIIATLNARCSVLAAANPVLGRYNGNVSIVENISLPVTLLSRFDLIFLLRDIPEEEHDRNLSSHILNIHAGRAGQAARPIIPQSLLRKYVCLARQITPIITEEAMRKIQEFYLKMRKESENCTLALGARELEAIIRISEAHARAALHDTVDEEDAKAAIRIIQKSLMEVGVDVNSGQIDVDILHTGQPKSLRDRVSVVLGAISKLTKENGLCEEAKLFDLLSTEYKFSENMIASLITKLKREGTLFEPREGVIQRT